MSRTHGLHHFLPRGAEWHQGIQSFTGRPEFEENAFLQIARELDRSHSLGELERRDPLISIMKLLAGWASRWETAGSPLFPKLIALWNPTQNALQQLFFDVFPGEYAVIRSLPGPRFVSWQNVATQSIVVLFHRPSTFVATAYLHAGQGGNLDAPNDDPILPMLEELSESLPKGWDPIETRVFLAGGTTGDNPAESGSCASSGSDGPAPLGRFQQTFLDRGIDPSAISTTFARSETGISNSFHLVFDRQTGRLAPLHPGYSSVEMNLRPREAFNRSLADTPRAQSYAGSSKLRRVE